jgi:hypothetical protein
MRRVRLAWMGAAFAVPITIAAALRGPELTAALLACPPLTALGAIAVHAATLYFRCEAWRVAVGGIQGRRAGRVDAHAAGGAGFAAGTLQGAGTAPLRAVALRRLRPDTAPRIAQSVVAEVPVFLLEAGFAAAVLAVAIAAAPVAPAWVPAAVAVGSAAGLAGLGLAARRAPAGRLASGLAALRDPRRRLAIVGLIAVVTALGLARAWVVLVGFGLPHGPSSVALTFIALGVFGLLPIGPASTPGALLAVFGAADATAATAAGIAISASSFAGVAVYGTGALSYLGLDRRVRSRLRRRDVVRAALRPGGAVPADAGGAG